MKPQEHSAQFLLSVATLHAAILSNRSYKSAFANRGTPPRKHMHVKPPAATIHAAVRAANGGRYA